MNKILLNIAILALGSSASLAQEYQDQSTVYGRNSSQTTYEDGSTSTTRWHVNPLTGALTSMATVNTHPTPAPTPTPIVPAAMNHSHVVAHTAPVVQPAAVEREQAPVTAISQSYAEMQAGSAAGAARVKAEQEAAKAHHQKP